MDREPGKGENAGGGAGIKPLPASRLEVAGAALVVALLIGFTAWYLTPSIFRAWFFMSDEWVVVGEAIRFTNLNFHQHFFDQPETPLMIIPAVLWGVIYGVGRIAGAVPAGINDFNYHHLAPLFEISRAISFLPGLAGIALVFVVASRVTNRAGGVVAAMLVCMCPDFAKDETYIRPEPLAICLFMLATLCLLRGLSPESPVAFKVEARRIFAAGLCAGLAAAARFHSITATIPLLLMILLSTGWPAPAYPERFAAYWNWTLRAAFAGAIAAMIGIKTGLFAATAWGKALTAIWTRAFPDLFVLCAVCAAVPAAIWAMRYTRQTAWLAARLSHPRMLMLTAGTVAGVLIGTPTMLWNAPALFASIQGYTTTYLDRDRLSWPLLQHLAFLFSYYMKVIAADKLSLTLIAIGAVLVVIRRDRKALPFLINAPLFFAFRPVNLPLVPHHVLLWLPMFAILAGYGVAQGYEWMGTRTGLARLRLPALAGLIVAMFASMNLGPRVMADLTRQEEQRMHSIAQATDWIHRNTEPGAMVAFSFHCLNSDGFLEWMRFLQVPVPAWTSDGRRYRIWWGDHSWLANRTGYACVALEDVDALKRQTDQRTPGEGTNPYVDAGFTRLETYGAAESEVDVFRFDFSHPGS